VKKLSLKKPADDMASGCAPSDAGAPNAATREAISQLEAGKGKHFTSVDALMADLNADD
jgi:DNA-damage-inducible protein J